MKYTTSFTSYCPAWVQAVLLSFFLLITTSIADAQNVVWANGITNASDDITVKNICIGSGGESFAVGFFYDKVDFDAGVGIDTISTGIINGIPHSRAGFVTKTDNAGNHMWAKAIIPYTDNSYSEIYDVATDAGGNVYVVGRYFYTVDFDPGPGIDSLDSHLTQGTFLIKLNPAGNLLWAKTIAGSIIMYTLKTDQNNDVIISGLFNNTVDFDPGPSVYNMTTAGGAAFVMKLDNSGGFIWANFWQGSQTNYTMHPRGNLDIDNGGYIYVSGGINANPIDLDPGPAVSTGSGTTFAVKLDPMGNFVWGHATTAATCVLKVSKKYELYTSGTPPLYGSNAYISKYDSAGALIWTKIIEDPLLSPQYLGLKVSSITEDTVGNVILAGKSAAKYILYSADSAGIFLWVKKSKANIYIDELCAKINASNDLMLAGDFKDVFDVDFGPNADTVGEAGKYAVFLVKYNYCGNNFSFNYNVCDSLVLADTTLYASANYVKEYPDMANCDSNVFIHAIVNVLKDTVINVCDSAVYNGQTYTQSGVYTQIFPPFAPGCDSVKQIFVNINTPAGLPPFLNLVQTFQPVSVPLIPQLHVLSYNIEIDSLYNMYISGGFVHHCDFNPLGVQYIDSSFYDLYGQFDGFVTRYDSSGILTWMHKIQTNDPWGSESTRSICLNDTLDLFSTTVVPAGISKCVVNKFNYSNTYFGATPIWGGGPWIENQVLNDPTSSSIVKIGYYDSISGFQSPKKFLAVWRGNDSVTFSVGGNFLGYQGAIDSQGNIYVASNMQPIDGGVTYCTIAKLDSNLNMLWNKQIAKGDEWGFTPLGTRINQLKVDTNGSLILCGRFSDTLDIDISPNTYNLISNGGFDAFIARFDTSANFIWAKSFGGAGDDVANTIITDMNGKIYVGGTFASASIDLDPSAGISFFMKNCVNTNWEGGYISKYKPDGTFMKAMGTGSNITELEFRAPKRIYSTGYPFVQVFELDYDTTVYNNVSICIGDSIVVGNNVYTLPGIYIDTLSTMLGSDSIVVTTLSVNPLPAPVLVFNGDTLFCTNVPGSNLYWYKDTVLVDSLTDYYVVSQNGFYQVMVVDTNGCIGEDSISILNVGSALLNKSDIIQVFPNPTNKIINISFEMRNTGEVELVVNDLLGTEIYSSKRKIATAGKQLLNIDLTKSNLNTGIYFLNIIKDGRRNVIKIEYQK